MALITDDKSVHSFSHGDVYAGKKIGIKLAGEFAGKCATNCATFSLMYSVQSCLRSLSIPRTTAINDLRAAAGKISSL